MNINTKALNYFVATAETGQVSLAAKALYISQSVITTAIKDLERQLGNALFIRTAQGMRLTEFGLQFLPRAQETLANLADLSQFSQHYQEVQAKLTIGVTYTVCGYFWPAHSIRLSKRYPNLQLQIVEMRRNEIEEKLLNQQLDCALLLTSNLQEKEKLRHEVFLESKRRLWLSTKHPLLQRSDLRFKDIASEPYIMLNVDEAQETARHYWQQHGVQPSVRLTTSSTEAVRSMVANGEGITILSDAVYRPWSLEGKRIETVLMHDAVPSMAMGLAWHHQQSDNLAIKTLRNYFYQTYCDPLSQNLRR